MAEGTRSLTRWLSFARQTPGCPPPAGRGRTRKVSRGTQVTPPAPHRKRPKRAPSHPLRRRRAEGAGTQPGSVGPERARLPKWERARAGLARRGVRGAPGTRGGRTHPESRAESEPGRPGVTLRGQRERGEEWGEEPGRRRPEAHRGERKRRRRRGGGRGSGSYLLRAGAPAASSSA